MINQNRLVDSFIELVKINSPSLKELELANYLTNKLKSLGFEVSVDHAGRKFAGEVGNVIGFKKGNKKGGPLLFSAHMDTVQPTIGIKPIIEDGIIKTDGNTILGADDKSGIAAFLEAAHCIKERNIEHPDLEVVFTVAEEIGLLGANYLDYSGLKSKTAFVLDSGGPVGTIIVQSPTQVNLNIKVKGKAAHAGVNPEDGINAIFIATTALSKLTIGRIDKETTNNIGIIKGGKATNIVPDEVEIQCEIRSMDQAKLDQQLELFKAAFNETVNQFGGSYSFEIGIGFKGFNLDKNNRAVRLAIHAAEGCNLIPVLTSRGGGSDANVFNLKGLEAVNLGVGIYCDHTPDEYIAIDDLVKCSEMLLSLMSG